MQSRTVIGDTIFGPEDMMSTDLTIIFGTLGAYALLILCLIFLMTRGHQRMDEVVTGVVNGVPIKP